MERFRIEILLTIATFAAATFIFLAAYFHASLPLFYFFAVRGYSVFLPQISIFLSNYLEDFFTPWEGSRLFPLIESAETIGAIVGGVALATLGSGILGGVLVSADDRFLFVADFGPPQSGQTTTAARSFREQAMHMAAVTALRGMPHLGQA